MDWAFALLLLVATLEIGGLLFGLLFLPLSLLIYAGGRSPSVTRSLLALGPPALCVAVLAGMTVRGVVLRHVALAPGLSMIAPLILILHLLYLWADARARSQEPGSSAVARASDMDWLVWLLALGAMVAAMTLASDNLDVVSDRIILTVHTMLGLPVLGIVITVVALFSTASFFLRSIGAIVRLLLEGKDKFSE